MSNDCNQLLLVEKLADGEVSGSLRREAEAHLERCAACQEHLGFLTTLHARTRELTYAGPNEEYWDHLPRRVLKRLGSETRPRGLSGLLAALFAPGALRFSALGAAIVILAAVGVTVYRDGALRPDLPEMPEMDAPSIPEAVALAPPAAPAAQAESDEPPMARDELPTSSDPVDSSREKAEVAESSTERGSPASPPKPTSLERPAPELQVEDRAEQELLQSAAREHPQSRARENAPAALATFSVAESAGEDCGDLRRALSSVEPGDRGTADPRYRLALCSIGEHEIDSRPETLELATADAEGFLAVEPEGARADEIRAKLEALRAK